MCFMQTHTLPFLTKQKNCIYAESTTQYASPTINIYVGDVCVCVLREPLQRIVSSAPYKTGVCVSICPALPFALVCVLGL